MAVKAWCNRAADNMRLAKSLVVKEPGVEVYDCISVPRYAFIWNAWLQVIVAGSSDNVQMGFRGNGAAIDDDFFLSETQAAATATGLKPAIRYVGAGDIQPFIGLWCQTAGGMITLTVDTAQTTGSFVVLAAFTILH